MIRVTYDRKGAVRSFKVRWHDHGRRRSRSFPTYREAARFDAEHRARRRAEAKQ